MRRRDSSCSAWYLSSASERGKREGNMKVEAEAGPQSPAKKQIFHSTTDSHIAPTDSHTLDQAQTLQHPHPPTHL